MAPEAEYKASRCLSEFVECKSNGHTGEQRYRIDVPDYITPRRISRDIAASAKPKTADAARDADRIRTN